MGRRGHALCQCPLCARALTPQHSLDANVTSLSHFVGEGRFIEPNKDYQSGEGWRRFAQGYHQGVQ